MEKVLTRTQSELVAAERRLLLAARDTLQRADAPPEDVGRLEDLLHDMDELFLLVVVGEYNTGKSTFINALLGDEVFEMGDLPTTRAISILRFGEAGPAEPAGEHLRVQRYPLDALQDLEIVDTPGTNSIERMEEQLTREFVPRADLVLFVTSLLQPLTASELEFLGDIRQWGKKVVFVVNGVDRRNSEDQLGRVREYLEREVVSRLGGPKPAIYFISALQALRAKLASGSDGAGAEGHGAGEPGFALDPRNEYPALESYLLQALRETERVRLKLLSPLGVLSNVLERNAGSAQARLEAVREDDRILRSIRQQLAQYVTEMETDSERYLSELRNVLYDIERRGRNWFEDTIRLRNFGLLRNKDAVENRFRNEVLGEAPRRIEEVVHGMVDWMVRNNLKLWNAARAELESHGERLRAQGALAPGAGGDDFHYNREDLFARLRSPVERRLAQFDPDSEAREIVNSVNASISKAFGAQAVAGLGVLIAVLVASKVADVTGLLTATLFAVAGLLVLPARRRKLQKDLEETVAKLNADLGALLSGSFREQLERYEQQLLEVIQPYGRFLETEREKLERATTELDVVRTDAAALERRVLEAFPEELPLGAMNRT